MQVVIAITRDLRKTAAVSADAGRKAPSVLGHLVVVDSGPSSITPGTSFELEPQTNIGRGPTFLQNTRAYGIAMDNGSCKMLAA